MTVGGGFGNPGITLGATGDLSLNGVLKVGSTSTLDGAVKMSEKLDTQS